MLIGSRAQEPQQQEDAGFVDAGGMPVGVWIGTSCESERMRQQHETEAYWTDQASAFDDQPDHGLSDPLVPSPSSHRRGRHRKEGSRSRQPVPPRGADRRLCDTRQVIRSFADDDLDGVLDVWYRASVEAHSFLSEAFFESERRHIAEQWLPASETSVFELDRRVLGFVSMLGNEVGGIFVDPEYQGRGVGRALLDSVAARRPYVVLDVFEANHTARGFYRTYGFHATSAGTDETTGLPVIRLRFDPAPS